MGLICAAISEKLAKNPAIMACVMGKTTVAGFLHYMLSVAGLFNSKF